MKLTKMTHVCVMMPNSTHAQSATRSHGLEPGATTPPHHATAATSPQVTTAWLQAKRTFKTKRVAKKGASLCAATRNATMHRHVTMNATIVSQSRTGVMAPQVAGVELKMLCCQKKPVARKTKKLHAVTARVREGRGHQTKTGAGRAGRVNGHGKYREQPYNVFHIIVVPELVHAQQPHQPATCNDGKHGDARVRLLVAQLRVVDAVAATATTHQEVKSSSKANDALCLCIALTCTRTSTHTVHVHHERHDEQGGKQQP